MTKKEESLFGFLMALSGALIFILGSLAFTIIFTESNRQTEIVTEIKREFVYDTFLTRENVNDTITEENYFFILGYYTEMTGNREVAQAIVDASLRLNVPVNLALALSFVESSFNVDAVNESNSNGTIDRGLFQLNSATFRNVNIDFFDMHENIEAGLNYLITKYERYGSWESAVVMYNAGIEVNLSNRSLTYLSRILQRERLFDEGYNSFRRNFNNYRNRDN